MRLFKRKKPNYENRLPSAGPGCTYCGSGDTVYQPGSARAWRGQRYLTYRCRDCGRDFYTPEIQPGRVIEPTDDIDDIDEDTLHEAEAELQEQIEEDGDHTFH